ncbi:MAG: TetR family transcriptional regulator [Blastocatellia bacterium]|nr:TetR family transcriptional regulator [Blastocatellia bacterium]
MAEEQPQESGKQSKAEQTRALILQTALDLFREKGYEETTMRAIAEKAGVSLGNAYYYFRSKEHLIQAFYGNTHEDHQRLSARILTEERSLKARLLGVMRTKLESIEPYHQFAGILFKTAADPNSPLNPFSPESSPVRQASTELFAQVLKDSRVKVPPDLQQELPNLLWMYHMGIVLFWIHDQSPRRWRTHRLVEHTVDIVAKLITLASLAIMKPVRTRTLRLLADLRKEIEPLPAETSTASDETESKTVNPVSTP